MPPRWSTRSPDYVVRNICPYCSISCGIKVAVKDGAVIDIYGDETSVINRGSLCSKGSALIQLVNNDQRVTEPMIKYNNKWYTHSSGGSAGWTDILKSGVGAAG
ncbi:MAG: hypothetical protein KJ985_02625, partial [Proteobacteria bacterium]|nr:hypothetical protein [Pseudomonadota bacterium]